MFFTKRGGDIVPQRAFRFYFQVIDDHWGAWAEVDEDGFLTDVGTGFLECRLCTVSAVVEREAACMYCLHKGIRFSLL